MPIRITGMGSGLDIDKLVSDMMKAERIPFDKLKQKKTRTGWTSDLYREINTKLTGLRNTLSKIRLQGDWKDFKAISSNDSAVSATTQAGAAIGNHKIIVNKLASGASVNSSVNLSTGSIVSGDISGLAINKGENDQIQVSYDGTTKVITLDPGTYSASQMQTQLQDKIKEQFGPNNKIKVDLNGTKLNITADENGYAHKVSFNSVRFQNNGLTSLGFVERQANSTGSIDGKELTDLTIGTNNNKLKFNLDGTEKIITLDAGTYTPDQLRGALQAKLNEQFAPNNPIQVDLDANKLKITAGTHAVYLSSVLDTNQGLNALGIAEQQSNNFNPKAPLGRLFSGLTEGSFTVNGQEIKYNSDSTLNDIISKVNNSAAGVKMTYDDLNDKIIFTTKNTGSSSKLELQEAAGGLLSKLGIPTGTLWGQDAEVNIDGNVVYSGSNTVTTNGVTYTLKQTTTEPVSIQVAGASDGMIQQIKDFIEQYNSTVELLNQRSKEKKFRNFSPLTEEQKKDMKEADIKKWEEKAKSGLLHSDQIVNSTLRELRSYVTGSVTSIAGDMNALYKIGINTMPYNANSPNDSGKLVIDEEQLKKSITEDAGGVVAIFSNQPDGIANKMFAQVNKSINQLIEKAGGVGSPDDSVSNTLGLQMRNLNKKIESFDTKLKRKEDHYYQLFAKMDSAVGKNNSQLNWLMQNMGK